MAANEASGLWIVLLCVAIAIACFFGSSAIEQKNTSQDVETIQAVVNDKVITEGKSGEPKFYVTIEQGNKMETVKVSEDTYNSYKIGDTISAERVVVTRFGIEEEPFFRVSSENE